MAERWQIACVKKTNRSEPYDCIERAGGQDDEGWTLHVDDIIAHIRKGDSFWVNVRGQPVEVIIASHSGREYIKTRSDGEHPNNLLSFPECY